MILIAFLAGLISFLSPCVLPIIPSYLSYITGMSVKELSETGASKIRFRVGLHAGLFILGFSLVFMVMGASATALGQFFLEHQRWFRRAGGVLILFFGLGVSGILKIPFLSRERRLSLTRHPSGFLGSVLIGAVFAFGWSPCVGPILASILVLAGTSEGLSRGLLLLACYSLGLGVPFFLAAIATGHFLSAAKALQRHLAAIERASGVLLIGIGLLLLTGLFTRVTASLNRWMAPTADTLIHWEERLFGERIP